ncbi:MAG: DUF2141 domain-containing protein [Leptolyngbya sp. SIO1E4]|nr:DUF2141 domain-containing protein [Leptolyngbya sp. SIO1E4]
MRSLDRCVRLAALGLAATLGCLMVSAQAQAEFTGNLTVEIDGFRDRSGQVCLALFSGSQGFPEVDGDEVSTQCVSLSEPISEASTIVTLDNLTLGNYAIALYHDSNGDAVLNTNQWGIPTEGFGFSNNPPVTIGPASYQDSMFLLAGTNTTIQITLQYL